MNGPIYVISMRQIKAARAILDWSQDDLAEASGLSVATIRNLEMGHASPRGKTNQLLIHAFEKSGLEFIERNGVREKAEEISIFEGREGIRRFYKDVEEASARGGDIVQVWPSSKGFENIVGEDIDLHVHAMMKLKDYVPHKCIFTEVSDVPPRPRCEHRYLSKHFVDSVPFFVYEDKYAIVSFTNETKPKIIVIQSAAAAASFRKQFYSVWDKATVLEKEKEQR